MKFALWLKQAGEGCDYTVGCGSTLVDLKSQTVPAATEEAVAIIDQMTSVQIRAGSDVPSSDSRVFEKALLLIVGGDLSNAARDVAMAQAAKLVEERRQAKLAQIETLKAEVGLDLPPGWKRIRRSDRGIYENVCPHGVGHPAEESIKEELDRVHGCDGCCAHLEGA